MRMQSVEQKHTETTVQQSERPLLSYTLREVLHQNGFDHPLLLVDLNNQQKGTTMSPPESTTSRSKRAREQASQQTQTNPQAVAPEVPRDVPRPHADPDPFAPSRFDNITLATLKGGFLMMGAAMVVAGASSILYTIVDWNHFIKKGSFLSKGGS